MVHVSGGRATAAAIPGAELLLVDGMGHDLPPALFETFADGIRRTADRAPIAEPAQSSAGEQRTPAAVTVDASVRSVGEALAGVGVEDVHVLRVGGDVDRVALVHRGRGR